MKEPGAPISRWMTDPDVDVRRSTAEGSWGGCHQYHHSPKWTRVPMLVTVKPQAELQ